MGEGEGEGEGEAEAEVSVQMAGSGVLCSVVADTVAAWLSGGSCSVERRVYGVC
jgi:hypothetical protein